MKVIKRHSAQAGDDGSMLLEAIIALPVLLLVSLGVAQFAQIWLCRTMVQYAAYCGARATLVAPAGAANELRWAQKAAEIASSPIAFVYASPEDAQNDMVLPGITLRNPGDNGVLRGSGSVFNQNILSVNLLAQEEGGADDGTLHGNSVDQWHRGVQVTMWVPLIVPFAGPVIGQIMGIYDNMTSFRPTLKTPTGKVTKKLGTSAYAYMRLRERAFVFKPFLSSWNRD